VDFLLDPNSKQGVEFFISFLNAWLTVGEKNLKGQKEFFHPFLFVKFVLDF
jgi:hypothetical protein